MPSRLAQTPPNELEGLLEQLRGLSDRHAVGPVDILGVALVGGEAMPTRSALAPPAHRTR